MAGTIHRAYSTEDACGIRNMGMNPHAGATFCLQQIFTIYDAQRYRIQLLDGRGALQVRGNQHRLDFIVQQHLRQFAAGRCFS